MKAGSVRVPRPRVSSSGIAYIELVVALPVVLMLILGGLEYGNWLRMQARMSAINRELGGTTYRGPALPAFNDFENSGERALAETEINGDLAELMNSTLPASTALVPEVVITLSVFKWDETPPNAAQVRLMGRVSSAVAATSRISTADISNDPQRLTLIQEQTVLAYSETFLIYDSLFPLVGRMLGVEGREIYAAAAF